MGEEKIKILEMLEKGVISVEEAATLLQQVAGSEPEFSKTQQSTHKHIHKNHSLDFDWIDHLKDSFHSFRGKRSENFTAESSDTSQGIKTIKLQGKNDKIELIGYEGKTLQLSAKYYTHGNSNPHMHLEESHGTFRFNYDENVVHSISIVLKVPKIPIKNISIDNKNASILVRNLSCEKTELFTKNASITVEDFSGKHLDAETKNAKVKIYDSNLDNIEVKTSNAKIELDDVKANYAKLSTSNAKITASDSDICEVIAKTSNASLYFEYASNITNSNCLEYFLEATSSNANIIVNLPHISELGCHLRASTSYGHIRNNLSTLKHSVSENNYMEAKSENFENLAKKITVNLKTTNANITIQ